MKQECNFRACITHSAAGKSCISNQVRFQGLVYSYPACALGFHVIASGCRLLLLQVVDMVEGLS